MRQLLTAVAVAVFLTFIAPAVPTAAPAASGPCGTASASSTHYTHVLWIWEENRTYSSIVGSKNAPYINSLASACGLATNYHNVTHPSLPNYMAATSGLPLGGLSPFATDCRPTTRCSTNAPSIFSQVSGWKAYEETMPSDCDKRNSGTYLVRHNPPAYYTTLAGCSTNDVPYTQLKSDLAGGKLPAFSFVTPNAADDMHGGTTLAGDKWLASNLPAILGSSAYTSGTLAVFITWDEGAGGTATDCATNTTDVGCHVPTLVISPSTKPGTASSTLFNHYSLLATAESLLRVPALGSAAMASSMVSAFNL